MIKSMTGFGRYENVTNDYKVTVEIKSVNHRYLDVNIKLLKKFGMFESRIRKPVKEYAGRGKIDIYTIMKIIQIMAFQYVIIRRLLKDMYRQWCRQKMHFQYRVAWMRYHWYVFLM